MPTPAEIPCSSTDPDEQSSTGEQEQFNEQQLQLQFFALLDGYSRNPPERVYWRDAVKLRLKHAIQTAALWIVHNRRVTPRTVHHAALAVYYYANAAGMIQVPQAKMAEDCEIDSKSFTRAIIVLKRLGLLRAFRTSRRSAETLAMNVGGLTWVAARQQARDRRRLARATNLDLDFETPSGGYEPPLNLPSGGYEPPPWAVRKGANSTYVAAVPSTPRARETDQPQQQQQNRRLEGLISAIAVRSRKLGRRFDETEERRRLEAGQTDIEALQRQADDLSEEIRNPPPLSAAADLAERLYQRNGRHPTAAELQTVRMMLKQRG